MAIHQVKMTMMVCCMVLISGCMTMHDREISGSDLRKDCAFESGAVFQGFPDYISDGKEMSPVGGIGRLFGNYDKSISAVRLSDDGHHVAATFFKSDNDVLADDGLPEARKYQAARGGLIINKWSSCKPGEAGVGCVWGHTVLSCTADNDLVVREVSRGVGLIALIIPIYTSSSFMGIYKRLPEL